VAVENKVINYEGNQISLFAPERKDQRDIAYVRPGDELVLNFDIRDSDALKLEIVKGDLHIIFQNGSTLTLASMAALGFSENAPKLRTLDGKVLSLEEFLSVTEVLNYNEAVLILANQKQVEYSDAEPKIVQVASDQDAENDAGIPIAGQGNSDLLTNGVPAEIVNPNGVTSEVRSSFSTGSFVSTIWTSNDPYTMDKTNYLPGDTTNQELPNLVVTVKYGSNLSYAGVVSMGGNNYDEYKFENGFAYTDDANSQIEPRNITYTGSNNVFVNNSTENMNYVFDMKYNKGVFPSRIEIVVPKEVADFVTLSEGAGLSFSSITANEDGDMVYAITNINPLGSMQFIMSFPEDTPITSFELSYNIGYIDFSSGEYKVATTTTPISLYPVTSADQLDKTDGFVLSTHANPINVSTGSGDDVIVGGGGNNTIKSLGGNNKVFTYGGNDIVELKDGNDEIWAGGGNNLLDGGQGSNTLRYDNKNTGIDQSGVAFKESYYKTNTSTSGLFLYLGFEVDDLKGFAGDDFINASKIKDTSILIKKSQGVDIVTNIQTIYLSGYNDVVTISNKVSLGYIVKLDGGDVPTGSKADNDTLIIDDSFDGAVIRFGQDIAGNLNPNESVVNNSAGNTIVGFSNFEQVKGSVNSDTFYGNIFGGFTGTDLAIAIDGAGGYNVLSYKEMNGSIIFDANTGDVQKKDASDIESGKDKIKNIQEIESSDKGSSTFYGSFSNNYTYSNLQLTDIVSYERATSGVTLVLDGGTTLFVYKTTSYYSLGQIPQSAYKDTLEDVNYNNLSLTNKKDVIIVTDAVNDYDIKGGGGRDVLSYADLSVGITVEFAGLTNANGNTYATVAKDGGGTDTFNIFATPNNINIYQIIGGTGDDTFIMDDSTGNTSGYSLDGGAGTSNTLSYANMSINTGSKGISFVLSGGGNSTATRTNTGISDYFINFQNFIGSDNDDIVNFSSTITMGEIQGMSFDLLGGNNKVSYKLLNSNQSDHIEVTFSGAIMTVTYQNGTTSTFTNTQGVIGTQGDDTFQAIDSIDLSFDGAEGTNSADYSLIATDLTFNMASNSDKNVIKGGNLDTLKNVTDITGGTQSNLYYLDAGSSYTINGGSSTNDTVSYLYALSGITFDVQAGKISKTYGTTTQTDTLINVETVKGSNRNDVFIVTDGMPKSSYTFYGNDVGTGSIMITPPADLDIVDFSRVTSAINITLDTSAQGSYNEYDATGQITAEGKVSTSANGVDYYLYHIEGITGTAQDDTFIIKSSYSGARGKSTWQIDGAGAGVTGNTVDYSQDVDVGIVNADGSWGVAIQVDLNANGARVNRNYSDINYQTARAQDSLKNVENLVLSDKDDTVTISTGWETSGVKKIDAGAKNSDPNANGDTLSFAGISDDIEVTFDLFGSFSATIISGTTALPDFLNFDNTTLSKGNSKVIFTEGTNFTNIITITTSSTSTATAILDFSALTSALTITLAQDKNGVDSLTGGVSGSIKLISTGNRYTVILSAQSNTVEASYAKNMDFTGTGVSNTLTYVNLGFQIIIDYSDKKIIKGGSNYDTFDDSFTTILGTQNSDTFLIKSIDIDLTGKTIDLGGQAEDKILIDILNAEYDIFTTGITATSSAGGDKTVLINVVQGVSIVTFGANDDKIVFTVAYENSTKPMDYAKYEGGSGNNTLDFSAMSQIIFDANTSKISKSSSFSVDYISIVWEQGNSPTGTTDMVFQNFYIIQGAKDSLFYAQARGDYTFIGGSGSNNILSYEKAATPVTIDLLSSTIIKSGNYTDTYSGITNIIGSDYNDTLVINQFVAAPSNISVDAGGGDRNEVVFDFDANSDVSVALFFDDSGQASYELKKTGQTTISSTSSFNGFNAYKLTENSDVVTRSTEANNELFISGNGGSNEITYNGSNDLIFDARTRIATSSGTNMKDTLTDFQVISYSGGTGKANFTAYMTANYTYKGDDKRTTYDVVNYSDAVIDYSTNSTAQSSISVDFTIGSNGLMEITKTSSTTNTDYFDGYITKIIGTQGNDTFILADRTGLPDISLEGGGGSNSVSYENLPNDPNGYTFEVNQSTGEISVIGTASFSGYKIDTATIRSVKLTNNNDTFKGSFDSDVSVDGALGVNTLDYSNLNGINIIIDFQLRNVVKDDNKGNYHTDQFQNFQSVKTGDGDDEIVIVNSTIEGTGGAGDFDVGGGRNILDASNISNYSMTVDYGDNYEASIGYTSDNGKPDIGAKNYKGFQEISLGLGASNVVNYTHNTTYESNQLVFIGQTNVSNTFNFKGTGTQKFFVDASNNENFFITTGGSQFLTTTYFNELSAAGTNYSLDIKAAGLVGSKTFKGGLTQADVIDYSYSTSALTATMMVDANSQQYIQVTNANGTFTDKLYYIEDITLSTGDDTFEVSEKTNYSTHDVTVDAGGGDNNTLSLIGLTTGQIFDSQGSQISVLGYTFLGFQYTILTSGNDEITFHQDGSMRISAGGGISNKADYSATDFTNGVSINMLFDGVTTYFTIQKKDSGDIDELTGFQEFTLTDYSDEFIYSGTGDNFGYVTQFNMGKGVNTVSFLNLDASVNGTQFVYDAGILSVTNSTMIQYQFKDATNIVLGGTGSTLVIKELPTIGAQTVTFDGGNPSLGTNLDLSTLSNGTNIVINIRDESAIDATNGNLGLSFTNFRKITGNTKVTKYEMTNTNGLGQAVSYTITTNNDTAEITYNANNDITEGINVVFGATDVIVTKQESGAIDTITGGNFGTITGTIFNDNFSIDNSWGTAKTINGDDGFNTLDFSKINVGKTISISVDLSGATGSVLVANYTGSSNLTAKEMTTIRGSNNSALNFTLNLTGIATSYQGIQINGGTGQTNSFIVTGGNVGSNLVANFNVSNIGVASYSTVIGTFGVGITLTDMQIFDFSGVEILTVVKLDDYETSGVTEIKGNATQANTLDLTSRQTTLMINTTGDILLQDVNGATKTTVTNFLTIDLKNGAQNIVSTSSVKNNLVINGGKGTASAPDTLNVDLSISALVLNDAKSIRLYDTNTPQPTSIYTTFNNFVEINVDSATSSSLYITSLGMNTVVNKVTSTRNNGVLYLVQDNGLVVGSYAQAVTLDITNFNNISIELSTSNSLELFGFREFNLGKASDTVKLDGVNSTPVDITVNGYEGNNKLIMNSWTSGAVLTIDGQNTVYHRTIGETGFTGTNFYTIDMSQLVATSTSEEKIIVSSLNLTQVYTFKDIEQLEFTGDSLKSAHIDKITVNGNTAEFSSNTNTSIYATWKDHGSSIDSHTYIDMTNSNPLDYDFKVEVYSMSDKASLSAGVYAPTMAIGYKAILDFSNAYYTATNVSVNINNPQDVITGGVAYNSPNGTGAQTMFYNFNYYIFDQQSHIFYYYGRDGAELVPDWTLNAGAGNKDTVDDYDATNGGGSHLVLRSGHIIVDTRNNAEHTWNGVEYFTNFTTVVFDISEEVAQTTFNEETTEVSSSKYNYTRTEDTESSKSFSEQMTYTLTEGDDTLNISEVKDNTVFDMMGGDNAIMFTGSAAYYNVEQFQDEYIILTLEDGSTKQFKTGGSYLVITDNNGNKMYILNADYNDVMAGGIMSTDEEGNFVSSGYQHASDNYDSNLPVANEKSSNSSNSSSDDSNSYYSNGNSNGATSYGRSFSSSSDSSQAEKSSQSDNNEDNNVNNDVDPNSNYATPANFELTENEGLELPFEDEVDLINQEDESDFIHASEEIFDDIYNVSEEESLDDLAEDSQSQLDSQISDQDLLDLINQTFTKEDDSIDNISLDLDTSSIDMSSINESLVEETILQESDIDGYKLESERNDDGTLKIHNQNGSNGNGGLGSF
jgi:hypothetical protein